jgi:small-conductance mechanosensitive channel
MILTDGEAGAALWVTDQGCPDDKTLAGWAADLEGHLGELLKRSRDMVTACRADLDGAVAEHEAATAAARAAQGRMSAAATPDAHAAAEHDYQAAMERVHAASLVIADCEAGLEILARTDGKLTGALNAARQIPADLAETYETPYQHIRENGPLPRDGDFLTPASR